MRMCTNPATPHQCEAAMLECPRCGYPVADLDRANEPGPDNDGQAQPGRRSINATTLEGDEARFFLCFPWGEEPVIESLAIGRDPEFSPLAGHLDDQRNPDYQYVSGRHARLEVRGDRLFVTHVGRSNPTWAAGCELVTGDEIEVHDGMELHFSSKLRCTVAIRW